MTDGIPRHEGHQLVLATPADEACAVTAWVRRGVDGGAKVLYAGSEALTTVEQLIGRFDGADVDLSTAADRGQLDVVDPARFYSAEGYERLVTDALADGYPAVRSVSSPDSAAGVLGDARFAEFEQVLDRACRSPETSALCRYDPDLASENDQPTDVLDGHPWGWAAAGLHIEVREPGRLHLHGEVDLANEAMLEAAMRAVSRDLDVLVLDCAQLLFAGVGAWRAIATATEVFRYRGGAVRMRGLHPTARRVLAVTGYDQEFELESES